MPRLFIYGTLQNPSIQLVVIGRVVPSTPDTLPNYEKNHVLLGIHTYPMVTPVEGSSVEGNVADVTEEELSYIDRYETEAYERVEVTLESGATAWVYRQPPQT